MSENLERNSTGFMHKPRIKCLVTAASGRFNFLGQFRNYVPVYERIHVPAQHIQYPPVTDVRLLGESYGDFHWNHPIASSEESWPHRRASQDDGPVDDKYSKQSGQDDEPEPYQDVRLLVHDVKRKDAKRVVFL